MKKISKMKQALLLAVAKGYKIDKNGIVYNPKGDVVNGSISSIGYKNLSIKIPNSRNATIVPHHRLQAYSKFGELIFEENIEVRHLNGDPLDNSWDNIEIGDHTENMRDICPKVRKNKAINASNSIRKFTDNQMKDIKDFYREVKSYSKTMKEFGIGSKGTLHYILNTEYQTTK